jgi:glycosyltransferase involved in cell wall biosynthesis
MKASVIVCTRNRKDNVVSTVKAILASDFCDFELIVCDQSDDDSTANSLIALRESYSRLKYYHLPLPGKPRALNFGCSQASGETLLFTDDDCEPKADWISTIVSLFESDPKVGCIFTTVVPAPHDPSREMIAGCDIANAVTLRGLNEFLIPTATGLTHFGIGASIALRKKTLEDVGGWDPCLGPGAKFGCADDHDIAVRVLIAGWHIHLSDATSVLHYGLRTNEEFSRDIERAGFGFGASFAKHIRCGRFYAGSWRLLNHFLSGAVVNLETGKRPLGLANPRGWIKGLEAGLKHPVDRKTRRFMDVSDEESRKWGNQFAQVILRSDQAAAKEERKTDDSLRSCRDR